MCVWGGGVMCMYLDTFAYSVSLAVCRRMHLDTCMKAVLEQI